MAKQEKVATPTSTSKPILSSSAYRASNCEGIVSLPFHLPLEESISKVVKALDVQGVVLIKAPPGSGKTSFITLLENCKDARLGKVVSKSMLGVPPTEWKKNLEGYRDWTSENTARMTILIDEIQVLYPEASADELWATLKRLTQKSTEQQKVRVICFASYGEKAGHSRAGTPFDFKERFGHELLRIDEAGVKDWIDKFNSFIVTYSAFPLELSKPLWFMTRGHLGLVAKTMWNAFDKFEREIEEKRNVSLEMLAEYLTSESFWRQMEQFRAIPKVKGLQSAWKKVLKEVLEQGGAVPESSTIFSDEEILEELIIRGYLVSVKERVEITTPLLELIIFNRLYQEKQTSIRDFRSLEEFLEECLHRIPRDVLANSLGVGKNALPLERTWQMEFYRIAWSLLPKGTYLSADVGSVFGSTGQLDFYVNTKKKWGIELLREGNGISKHCDRFSSEGIYASIPINDFVVIDFRSDLKQARLEHPKLWTVSYVPDFSSITISRMGKQPKTIILPEGRGEEEKLGELFQKMNLEAKERFIAQHSPKAVPGNPPNSSVGGGRRLVLSDYAEAGTTSTAPPETNWPVVQKFIRTLYASGKMQKPLFSKLVKAVANKNDALSTIYQSLDNPEDTTQQDSFVEEVEVIFNE